ncbi:MAG: hypothetical protein ACI8P3_003491, partial [Saprospiraceae bacterium]
SGSTIWYSTQYLRGFYINRRERKESLSSRPTSLFQLFQRIIFREGYINLHL